MGRRVVPKRVAEGNGVRRETESEGNRTRTWAPTNRKGMVRERRGLGQGQSLTEGRDVGGLYPGRAPHHSVLPTVDDARQGPTL